MKKFLLVITALIVWSATAAHAETDRRVFHYACKSGDDRYALTVNPNRGIVKLAIHGPPFTTTTFRIVNATPDACGKGGWTLMMARFFCYYTQGGRITWLART